MRDIRKKYSLSEAVVELKKNLKTHHRVLKQGEWRIIAPLLDGRMEGKEDEYVFKQDVLELCLIGTEEFPVTTPNILQVCREVAPIKMKSPEEWEVS